MTSPVYRAGMDPPEVYYPVPGFDRLHFLPAIHGPGWIARSYFVERERGNVLVSPLIYNDALADFLEARGGVGLIFVTHRDEIHPAVLSEVGREGPGKPPASIPAREYRKRFECSIAVHELDGPSPGDWRADILWANDEPWEPGIRFIHTPGHTPGSACLLLRIGGLGLLFCGDNATIDERGRIDTEVEEGDEEWVPTALENWAKMHRYDFDALIPLHTLAGSPVPMIARGARVQLEAAIGDLEAWNSNRNRPSETP